MKVEKFAIIFRLQTSSDESGEPIVAGKYGHLFAYDDRHLGLMYMPDPKSQRKSSPAGWISRRKLLIAAGFSIVQNGDAEGTGIFGPGNAKQAALAIRLAGCQRTKRCSLAMEQLRLRAAIRPRSKS